MFWSVINCLVEPFKFTRSRLRNISHLNMTILFFIKIHKLFTEKSMKIYVKDGNKNLVSAPWSGSTLKLNGFFFGSCPFDKVVLFTNKHTNQPTNKHTTSSFRSKCVLFSLSYTQPGKLTPLYCASCKTSMHSCATLHFNRGNYEAYLCLQS